MSKLPSMQWYPGDWRKDPGIQSLGYFERGVWFEMLNIMFESEERGVLILNGKPMNDNALARLLGLDKQILTTTLTTLLDYGVARRRESDQAIYNKRMVEDQKLRNVRAEAGKLGGNPLLLKQNPTTQVNQNPTTGVKQVPTPSSSSSSSSSSSVLNTYTLPTGAPQTLQSALQAWSTLQKQNFRRNVSQVEVDALIMSWAPRFAELEAAIIYSTANGWKNIREKTQEGSGTNGTHQAVYPKRQTAQEAKAERLKALHAKMTELDEQDRIAGKQVKITMGDIFK